MTRDEIPGLFVVLAGYWGALAPDVDDPVAVAGHLDLLADHDLDTIIAAARALAVDLDATYCPHPGQIAAACKPAPVPPYHRPFVLEDPEPDPNPDREGVLAELAAAREALRHPGKAS